MYDISTIIFALAEKVHPVYRTIRSCGKEDSLGDIPCQMRDDLGEQEGREQCAGRQVPKLLSFMSIRGFSLEEVGSTLTEWSTDAVKMRQANKAPTPH